MRYLIILLLLIFHPLLAQEESPAADGPEIELAKLLGSESQLMDIHNELVEAMIKSNPAMAPYQTTITAWAEQYITWEAIQEQTATMYQQYFTDEELQDMIAFYHSTTGKKLLLLMPTLFREGNLIGENLALEHRSALIEMLRTARDQPSTQ